MKRLLAALFCTTMLVALFGVATAAQAAPGPNDNNEKGLCTAYFNGQKKGHDKQGTERGESPGPFGELELLADDGDGGGDEDLESETWFVSDVFEFCDSLLSGLIGGQPEHNGRYDCRTSDGEPRDTDTDDSGNPAPDGQYECLVNDGTGDTGGDHPSGKDK